MTHPLVNRGDADLILGPIQTSCGCSTAIAIPNVVPPGSSARIVAEGQVPSVGSKSIPITVTTNDKDRSHLALRWELSNRDEAPRLMTSPPTVDVGIIRVGQIPAPGSIYFDVLEERDPSPLIEQASSGLDIVKVTGGVVDETGDDPRFEIRKYRFDLIWLDAPPVGLIAQQVQLIARDGCQRSWQTVPIRGDVLPVVRAIPSKSDVGPVGSLQQVQGLKFQIVAAEEAGD